MRGVSDQKEVDEKWMDGEKMGRRVDALFQIGSNQLIQQLAIVNFSIKWHLNILYRDCDKMHLSMMAQVNHQKNWPVWASLPAWNVPSEVLPIPGRLLVWICRARRYNSQGSRWWIEPSVASHIKKPQNIKELCKDVYKICQTHLLLNAHTPLELVAHAS